MRICLCVRLSLRVSELTLPRQSFSYGVLSLEITYKQSFFKNITTSWHRFKKKKREKKEKKKPRNNLFDNHGLKSIVLQLIIKIPSITFSTFSFPVIVQFGYLTVSPWNRNCCNSYLLEKKLMWSRRYTALSPKASSLWRTWDLNCLLLRSPGDQREGWGSMEHLK